VDLFEELDLVVELMNGLLLHRQEAGCEQNEPRTISVIELD